MHIYTAAPCNFVGTQVFYDRESGLTSRGFQSIGINSRSILLTPAKESDHPSLIRATVQNLQDIRWWKSLNIDALVFYTWGSLQYRAMVDAAKSAGVTVLQVTDHSGVSSPLAGLKAHLMADYYHYWYYPLWKRVLRTLCKLPISCTWRLFARDWRNAHAMTASDFFLASTPEAARRFRVFVARLVGKHAAEKVRFVPIPVNFHFRFNPDVQKLPEVVAVGRWDTLQKRTPLLIETINLALVQHDTVCFRIFGTIHPQLREWWRRLRADYSERVCLEGVTSNEALAHAYQRAQVMLVSSAYEGCHNASAEAVCCGTTVVACRSPFLSALEWHTSMNTGRLACSSTPESLSAALLAELAAWSIGERDPVVSSAQWVERLHPDRVAQEMCKLITSVLGHSDAV